MFLYPQTSSFKKKSNKPKLSVQRAPANASSVGQIPQSGAPHSDHKCGTHALKCSIFALVECDILYILEAIA